MMLLRLYAHVHNLLGTLIQKLPESVDRYVGGPLWGLYCDTRPRVVECWICKERYQSVLPGTMEEYKQGDGCAAAISKRFGPTGDWYLRGHYGSTEYDMDLFRFVRVLPTIYENADPVCDDCIASFISLGWLIEIRELPLGDLNEL